jgi:uncharacterized Zn finger protein
MSKKLWYEKLRGQCPKCKKYLAMEIVKETDNFIYWKCKFCGFKRKHKRVWAIFKHKGNRTFLKTNPRESYYEVDLKTTPKYIQIVPI